jgi:hypothetical protein
LTEMGIGMSEKPLESWAEIAKSGLTVWGSYKSILGAVSIAGKTIFALFAILG